MHVCVCVRECKWVCLCVCQCTHVYACVYMCMCVHFCVCVQMSRCLRTSMTPFTSETEYTSVCTQMLQLITHAPPWPPSLLECSAWACFQSRSSEWRWTKGIRCRSPETHTARSLGCNTSVSWESPLKKKSPSNMNMQSHEDSLHLLLKACKQVW
jgi:hypothetical protein